MAITTVIFPEVQNFIGGRFSLSEQPRMDVVSPLDGTKLSSVPLSSASDLDRAVQAAKRAQAAWAAMTIKDRVQILYRYRSLLERDREALAHMVHSENGKTMEESYAEVDKSIELTEFACSMPQMASGEIMEVSKGVWCRTERCPVGIVASIAPFNFPHMVPHWTIPNALALGNCMILKPSELVPITSMRIAEMLQEAGLPDGVFSVVNGGREIVEAICDHPEIGAVSFVGSTKVAQIVYRRSTQSLKRCLALGGAKNHLIVLPDAHVQMAASNIAASMSGCAGQRCMAAAAMVGVGNVDPIVQALCDEARKIVPGKNLGAVISAAAKARIEGFITEAEQQGAKVLVDGRNTQVPGAEGGFYVGPTVIDYVRPEMRIAQEEIFGPVIVIIRAKDIEEALEIENNNPYGNAAAVFTQNGAMATYVTERASAGMIGVNVGVPVPREPFAFGGWNESRFGAGDITGKSSIEFWTQTKKITTKWNPESRTNWMS